MEEFMLPCLNKQLFGLDCLGCGTQRAFLLMMQGEFADAFRRYPAIYPMLLLFSFLIFNLFIKFKFAWFIKVALIIITVVVIIVSYFYKMSHIFH